MENEKMMILKMLEEKKITAEEAARLLEAAGSGKMKDNPRGQDSYSNTQSSNNTAYKQEDSGPRTNNRQESFTSAGFDSFTSDLTKKFETIAKDLEPKLYKFTETVAEKTALMADKFSKTMSSTTHSSETHHSAYETQQNMQEMVYESVVSKGFNELTISGLNADVLIKGYNGDKISARIFYKRKKAGSSIEIMKLGNKYFLNYDEDCFEKVGIDAFIPEHMFNNISIQTINGRLSVSTIETGYINIGNSNGKTEVKQIRAENIRIDCNNGNVLLAELYANNGQIESFNGSIEATTLDIANLKMVSLNGAIYMNMAYYTGYTDYVWVVETSNGKMTLNLPGSPDLGYYVKAHTTLSNMKIGLTQLNYMYNDPSYVEAKSINFDSCHKRVKLSLETSNAPLNVN